MVVSDSRWTFTAGVLVAAAMVIVAACSSEPETFAKSGSAACVGSRHEVSELDRDVSFSEEVLPFLQGSCSYSSCHGTPGRNGIYLPPSGKSSSASEVRARLLEKAQLPSMPYVTPSNPEQSWLLRKLEGDFCGVTCEGGCGSRMPKSGDPLDPAALKAVATWIAKGAPDN